MGGITLALVPLVLGLTTRRAGYFLLALALIMTTGSLVWFERWITTPREEIAGVLDSIARDLATDDVSRVTRHISRTRPELIRHAEQMLRRYVIHQAKIKRNLTVALVPNSDPKEVVARFNAVLRGSERSGAIRNQLSPWFFIVQFVREDDAWKVLAYERLDPREGL